MQSVKGSDDEVAEGACNNNFFSVLLGLDVWRPQTGGLGFSSRVEVKAYLWSILGAPWRLKFSCSQCQSRNFITNVEGGRHMAVHTHN